MQEFDLVSVNWETVRLMQAGQFKQETYYLEELVRWGLQRGRVRGVLYLAKDGISKPLPLGGRQFDITIRGCYAVGRDGYVIEIPNDPQGGLRARFEANSDIVPLFIGVACNERNDVPKLQPTVDKGLLACQGLRRKYVVSSDDSNSNFDWVQVAQFKNTREGLDPLPDYVPECAFLSSYAPLWQKQVEITKIASSVIDELISNSSLITTRYLAAAMFAGSLAPAAQAAWDEEHPRAYVNRLAGVLNAQRAQLRALPTPNLTAYSDAIDMLNATILEIQGREWTTGYALTRIIDCLRCLQNLYPKLLLSLETTARSAPPQNFPQDTAVPAQTPSNQNRSQNKPRFGWGDT